MESLDKKNTDINIMVSIYCLAYNHGKYIRNTLESFMKQNTNFQYEVIVHDDASTDNTPDIIIEYAEKYPNVIKPIIQKENQYSKGVDIVSTYICPKLKGKYIAFCEGDDYWCSYNKLQRQVDFLELHPQYSACVHNTRWINCLNGKERLHNVIKQDTTLKTEDVLWHKDKTFHISSVMYRREYIALPEAFHAKGFGDYSTAIYLSMVGKIYYFKDVMSVYRYFSSEDSWSYKNSSLNGDVEVMSNHKLEVNRMLGEIDKYSQGKYHSIICNIQRENEFKILNVQGKYKKAYTEYKDIVVHLSKEELCKLMLKAYIPFLGITYKYIKHFTNLLSYKRRKNKKRN